MGRSQACVFVRCGLLSIATVANWASATPNQVQDSDELEWHRNVQTPDDAIQCDAWDTLSGWLSSLCSLVGCDLQSFATATPAPSSREFAVWQFIAKYEATAGRRGFTIDQKLIGNLAINEAVRVLNSHPEIMSKGLEDRLRFALESLRIDLSN